MLQTFPGRHDVHSEDALSPVILLNVPVGQPSGAMVPSKQNEPFGQGRPLTPSIGVLVHAPFSQ